MLRITINQAQGKPAIVRTMTNDLDALAFLVRHVETQTGEKFQDCTPFDTDELIEEGSRFVDAYFDQAESSYWCEELAYKEEESAWLPV